MASKAAQKRLSKEYVAMQKEPPPFVWAAPDEKNILNWNFLIRGPPDSPFDGGEYHGVLLFPSEYPFKPPGIKMYTPSGRFQPDKKICFSMSDFHPGSWNPAWSVATILTGLLSFMLSDEMTTGSVTSSDAHKRSFAARSHGWNISQQRFKEAFPDYSTLLMRDLPNMGQKERGKPDAPPPSTATPSISSSLRSTPQIALPTTISTATSSSSSIGLPTPRAGPNPLYSTLNGQKVNFLDAAQEARQNVNATSNSVAKPEDSNRPAVPPAQGWMATWRHFIYEKWRLCAFIALALMVSRFSTRT